MRSAAVIGQRFGMDPREVLRARGVDRMILVAAANALADMEKQPKK